MLYYVEFNMLYVQNNVRSFRMGKFRHVRSTLFRTSFLGLLCAVSLQFLVVNATASATTVPPRPDHVVIVMEENHAYSQIIGSSSAPYINSLAQQGALFTNSYAVAHPSQPNYVALFSGSTQGLISDDCPQTFSGPDLGSQLLAAKFSFTGYAEGLPSAGSTVCTAGNYARKHAPWVNFTDVPASSNQPFTSFPSDYSTLPAVSFVIPNLQDDMHSASIQQGDSWLQNQLGGYAQWAETHNSLLIVTWDEDNDLSGNHIPTIFVGSSVKPGQYSESITHYTVLRTLESMYGLSPINNSATVNPITDVWQ
jgi:phosphatidylinositol-3-phosphatase